MSVRVEGVEKRFDETVAVAGVEAAGFVAETG